MASQVTFGVVADKHVRLHARRPRVVVLELSSIRTCKRNACECATENSPDPVVRFVSISRSEVCFVASMSQSSINARFYNYPTPQALEHPYVTPAPYKNPTIKGSALHYLSNL